MQKSGYPIHATRLPVTWNQDLLRRAITLAIILVAVFLAFYNLTDYPVTWFDEGSHLHVPKTLVRYGVYADYSSEGFRYYGPTLGVGPTVMLPIAAVFRLLGIGLLQARMVMVVYLLGAMYVFFRLAGWLGKWRFASLATILVITSRSVGLLLWGRQVLGEVPGLFFLLLGLWLWFANWEDAKWSRLAGAGILLGLSAITKYQYLLFLGPMLLLSWLANLVYYRTASQRTFLVPGISTLMCFCLWQFYQLVYLGPATVGENLVALREAVAGAALSFSPALMSQSFYILLSPPTYLGALLPSLVYGLFLALPRRREGQQWGALWILVLANLAWYVVASVGWWRYAFLGLALGSLFVARFFYDLLANAGSGWTTLRQQLLHRTPIPAKAALSAALSVWLTAMIVLPLGESTWEIISPVFNAPEAMAAYLNEHVSRDALIETWEPEMGFLTDHDYHFPPAELLPKAVSQVYLDTSPLSETYDYVPTQHPPYVLVGPFAHGIDLYPDEVLAEGYERVTRIGEYELYARK